MNRVGQGHAWRRVEQAVATELARTRTAPRPPAHICYLCGQPARVELAAEEPIGMDLQASHHVQRDRWTLFTGYCCVDHLWAAAADLPHPTIRPL